MRRNLDEKYYKQDTKAMKPMKNTKSPITD